MSAVPSRLYVIADRDALGPRSLADAVEEMAQAGVRWIQVRAKGAPGALLAREIEECCRRLAGSGAELWLDDRVDLAALLPVAGVHLGQEDLPPRAARPLLPPERRIGCSTHSATQAAEAAADRTVDVVAVGPVFPTRGKERPDPVVGLDLVRWARRLSSKPLVAIGGIDSASLPEVLAAGADAAVVLGAVCRAPDLGASCRRLLVAAGAA